MGYVRHSLRSAASVARPVHQLPVPACPPQANGASRAWPLEPLSVLSDLPMTQIGNAAKRHVATGSRPSRSKARPRIRSFLGRKRPHGPHCPAPSGWPRPQGAGLPAPGSWSGWTLGQHRTGPFEISRLFAVTRFTRAPRPAAEQTAEPRRFGPTGGAATRQPRQGRGRRCGASRPG